MKIMHYVIALLALTGKRRIYILELGLVGGGVSRKQM